MHIIPANLPTTPGIYLFKNKKGEILYIGKAKNILKRIQQYFSPNSVRKQEMLNQAHHIDYITTQTETEALELEDNLIKTHRPPFNSLLRENHSYVYIKIPHEDFPQIYIVKKRKNDGATYIGPKYHSKELKNFLQFFRQLLQYRGCKITQFRQKKLCSDYYFGLCKGRCLIPSIIAKQKETNEQSSTIPQIFGNPPHLLKSDYHKITNSIQKFFEGDTKEIESTIRQQIDQAIQKQHFERAAKLRDILFHIDKITESQRVILDPKVAGYFFKIQEIGNRYVYVITKFFEGKLIDIITEKASFSPCPYGRINNASKKHKREAGAEKHHYSTKKEDKETLLTSFTGEFNLPLTSIHENFYTTQKKISKKSSKIISNLLDSLLENYIAKSSFEKENVMNDLLLELQSRYHIKHFPYHIECIDISHLSGGRTSGGLACFQGGIPYPYGYRKYKIQSADDYASLRELILRRFKLQEGSPLQISLPATLRESRLVGNKGGVRGGLKDRGVENKGGGLFILDGGKGQLSIISKIKEEFLNKKNNPHREKIFGNTTFISLGKGEARKRSAKAQGAHEEIFYFDQNGNIQSKKLIYDQVDKILTHIRDEAHRFANAYRKKQMSAERK